MRQCTRRVTRRLPVKCSIRPMMEADLREVLRIEYEAFPFAWKEGGFLLILRHGKFLAVVAEDEGKVIGYAVTSGFGVAADSSRSGAQLATIAVASMHRRVGIGTQLLQSLIDKARASGLASMRLKVREGNTAAQLFFRSHGFKATRVLRQHYEENDEDAYLMRLDFVP